MRAQGLKAPGGKSVRMRAQMRESGGNGKAERSEAVDKIKIKSEFSGQPARTRARNCVYITDIRAFLLSAVIKMRRDEMR